MRRGKWPFSDLFSVRGWPNRAKHGVRILTVFSLFLVFSHHVVTLIWACFIFNIYSFPHIFKKYSTTQHTTYTIHNHTRTHTCTPATDRDLESGLSESNARKNLEKCSEKGKVRGISGEGSFRDRRANRSSSAKCRKTNRTIWLMVPSEVSLILRKKRMIRGIGNVLFSNFSQTSNGQDPVVSPGEPLEQVITPRGPISVSLKLAMKDEPNIGLRSCSE